LKKLINLFHASPSRSGPWNLFHHLGRPPALTDVAPPPTARYEVLASPR
jgi:hypothetical protein